MYISLASVSGTCSRFRPLTFHDWHSYCSLFLFFLGSHCSRPFLNLLLWLPFFVVVLCEIKVGGVCTVNGHIKSRDTRPPHKLFRLCRNVFFFVGLCFEYIQQPVFHPRGFLCGFLLLLVSWKEEGMGRIDGLMGRCKRDWGELLISHDKT